MPSRVACGGVGGGDKGRGPGELNTGTRSSITSGAWGPIGFQDGATEGFSAGESSLSRSRSGVERAGADAKSSRRPPQSSYSESRHGFTQRAESVISKSPSSSSRSMTVPKKLAATAANDPPAGHSRKPAAGGGAGGSQNAKKAGGKSDGSPVQTNRQQHTGESSGEQRGYSASFESHDTDGEEVTCPLCMEVLDETDRGLFPCECGYQVCLWCLYHIRDHLGNKCPACRRDYDEKKFKYDSSRISELSKHVGRKSREKHVFNSSVRVGGDRGSRTRSSSGSGSAFNSSAACSGGSSTSGSALNFAAGVSSKTGGPAASGSGVSFPASSGYKSPHHSAAALAALKDMRVIQRCLVYVIGIPPSIAKKEILKKPEFFGQYGKVLHIVVNRGQTYTSHLGEPSCAVYVTYSNNKEAVAAIQGIDGAVFDGRSLKASFGTTKYCSHFLKGGKCPNPDCFYLHQLGSGKDSFTKEAMINAKHQFLDLIFPASPEGKKSTDRPAQTFGRGTDIIGSASQCGAKSTEDADRKLEMDGSSGREVSVEQCTPSTWSSSAPSAVSLQQRSSSVTTAVNQGTVSVRGGAKTPTPVKHAQGGSWASVAAGATKAALSQASDFVGVSKDLPKSNDGGAKVSFNKIASKVTTEHKKKSASIRKGYTEAHSAPYTPEDPNESNFPILGHETAETSSAAGVSESSPRYDNCKALSPVEEEVPDQPTPSEGAVAGAPRSAEEFSRGVRDVQVSKPVLGRPFCESAGDVKAAMSILSGGPISGEIAKETPGEARRDPNVICPMAFEQHICIEPLVGGDGCIPTSVSQWNQEGQFLQTSVSSWAANKVSVDGSVQRISSMYQGNISGTYTNVGPKTFGGNQIIERNATSSLSDFKDGESLVPRVDLAQMGRHQSRFSFAAEGGCDEEFVVPGLDACIQGLGYAPKESGIGLLESRGNLVQTEVVLQERYLWHRQQQMHRQHTMFQDHHQHIAGESENHCTERGNLATGSTGGLSNGGTMQQYRNNQRSISTIGQPLYGSQYSCSTSRGPPGLVPTIPLNAATRDGGRGSVIMEDGMIPHNVACVLPGLVDRRELTDGPVFTDDYLISREVDVSLAFGSNADCLGRVNGAGEVYGFPPVKHQGCGVSEQSTGTFGSGIPWPKEVGVFAPAIDRNILNRNDDAERGISNPSDQGQMNIQVATKPSVLQSGFGDGSSFGGRPEDLLGTGNDKSWSEGGMEGLSTPGNTDSWPRTLDGG